MKWGNITCQSLWVVGPQFSPEPAACCFEALEPLRRFAESRGLQVSFADLRGQLGEFQRYLRWALGRFGARREGRFDQQTPGPKRGKTGLQPRDTWLLPVCSYPNVDGCPRKSNMPIPGPEPKGPSNISPLGRSQTFLWVGNIHLSFF